MAEERKSALYLLTPYVRCFARAGSLACREAHYHVRVDRYAIGTAGPKLICLNLSKTGRRGCGWRGGTQHTGSLVVNVWRLLLTGRETGASL
jgi:hypothetical protein